MVASSRRSTSSRALGVARGAAMTPDALRTTEQSVGHSRGSACCLTLALYRPFAGQTRPAVLVLPLSFPLHRSGLLFIHTVEPLFRLGMEAGSGAIGSWRVHRDGRHVQARQTLKLPPAEPEKKKHPHLYVAKKGYLTTCTYGVAVREGYLSTCTFDVLLKSDHLYVCT